MIFERRFPAGWADVRIGFFNEHGFPAAECARRQIGPVIRRDDIESHHDMRLLDEVRVTLV